VHLLAKKYEGFMTPDRSYVAIGESENVKFSIALKNTEINQKT